MNEVRLDPQQLPARAELLLAAELGADAPGRPIYTRPEPDGHDDGEPTARIKVGSVLTRRLSAAEATVTPSGAAYGNPLRGRPERSSSVPIGSAILARTDTLDAHGWRVYRVTPAGTVIYDEWIDDDSANGELAVTRLLAAARRGPEAALRRVLETHGDHPAAHGVAEWLASEPVERPGSKKAPIAGRTTPVAPEARPPGEPRMTGHRTNALPAGGSLVTRERLERHGAGALADEELLTILVGVKGAQTAGAVLEACGTVQQLAHESTGDLARIKGMTPTRAAMVVAGVELGRRTLTRPRPDRQRLGTPREVAAFLLPHYGASPVERFGIISLCTKHRMLRTEIVSTGTLDASLVHPREVFRMAALHRAAAIVLFHNHPSGDPTPSHDDVALTARLQQAGSLMGIDVLDHVVLADTRYCSFKEMGRL